MTNDPAQPGLTIILSHRLEYIQNLASSDCSSSMNSIWWDHYDHPGFQLQAFPGKRELEFAREQVGGLFVWMAVLRQDSASLDLPERQGHVGAVHEARAKAGDDFPLLDICDHDSGR